VAPSPYDPIVHHHNYSVPIAILPSKLDAGCCRAFEASTFHPEGMIRAARYSASTPVAQANNVMNARFANLSLTLAMSSCLFCEGINVNDWPGSVYRTDASRTAAITHWNPRRSRAVCLMKIASPLCTIQAKKSLPRRLSSEAFDARGAFVRCRRCASVPSNAVRSACLLAQDAMV
jgi:hypothetical protein